MTTIAYRDGVLAADSRLVYGESEIEQDSVQKIMRTRDGRLLGGAGHHSIVATYMRALAVIGKKLPPLPKDCGSVIEVFPNREIIIHNNESWVSRGKIEYGAWGSGSGIAKGAMAMGASAVEAIKITSKLDAFTGGRIRSVKL